MNSFEHFPERRETKETEVLAEAAFEAGLAGGLFLAQTRDRHDFGTDYQLEACDGSKITNLRVHVQVKGTKAPSNTDGTVSVSVRRSNLEYLLNQPDSVYVCWHIPSQRLLSRYASDILHEYESRGGGLRDQGTVTVRFVAPFDEDFQERLHRRVLASGRAKRDERASWLTTPPHEIPGKVSESIPDVEVPTDPELAQEVLEELYHASQHAVIAKAHDAFCAVFGDRFSVQMTLVFLSEINLGIRGLAFNRDRVRDGIEFLHRSRNRLHPASFHYCLGNAWLALEEYEESRVEYLKTLAEASEHRVLEARANKNLGSAMEKLDRPDTARECYERALEIQPDLREARWALSMWFAREREDFPTALSHLDQVVVEDGSPLQAAAISGWRCQFLFGAGRTEEAFQEVQRLLNLGLELDWAWPWSAGLVARYGRTSAAAAGRSVQFWHRFLKKHPGNSAAQRERLLCHLQIRASGGTAGIASSEFEECLTTLIDSTSTDSEVAFLWDRLGHWFQYDGDWGTAVTAYQRACEIEPERFGYCLGTALNFLRRFDEALPILTAQAEDHIPDAKSWFQVAIAREGVQDIPGCISAYEKALRLDPSYDLAWFNLGGIFWNSGDLVSATGTWQEAARRFPDHDLVRNLPPEVFL